MDRALELSLSSKPYIKGLLCADSNGLLIAVRGDMDGRLAGRFSAMSREAASLSPEQQPPVILIETRDRHIVVKDYDNITLAMSCVRTDE